MNNIFEIAEKCLHQGSVNNIVQLTQQAWQLHLNEQLDYQSHQAPQPISATRFPQQPLLINPRKMPRRKLTTIKGLIAFFHAIAHIEFIAIYLAWDMLYRFRGMPQQFYQDWLRVADEEAQHFTLIRQHLLLLGVNYGDLSAHRGLWDVACDTDDDILARLALVPRFMEAHGLDVTPQIIEKLSKQGDNDSVLILTRILNDEVGHVKLGSDWFTYVCQQRQLQPLTAYQHQLKTRLTGSVKGVLNRKLRLAAGFSEQELDWLESLQH